ncbi:MAG: hypothetical protein DYG89_35960 [Caldilinea sp. CFX5]|nr:hypothetical protein [Caldilinea sp. CFX5]
MTVRINAQRLLRSVVTTFVLPMALAMWADWQLAFFPLVTIGATAIFMPLATVIVIRAALAELDQLIQKVAPIPVEADAAISENTVDSPVETLVSPLPVVEGVDTKINSNVLQKIR